MTKKERRRRVDPDADRAVLAPIDLRAFTGRERELEECLALSGAHLVHIVCDDGSAAGESLLAQQLEDLLAAVVVTVEQAHHLCLERIEQARAWRRLAWLVMIQLEPGGDSVRMQVQGGGSLGNVQVLPVTAIADLAPGFVIDHGRLPRTARKPAIFARMSSVLICAVITGGGGMGAGAAIATSSAST